MTTRFALILGAAIALSACSDSGPAGDGAECGDGVVEGTETCDDGNRAANDGCRADCTLEVCGDGVVEASEACDDGNTADGDGCRGDCTGAEICGDRLVDPNEECDDGNTSSGDGCSATCTNEVTPACGDDIPQTGEECDLGAANDDVTPGACPSACRTDCTCPACGDGVVDAQRGEECDDGNTTDADACSNACKVVVGSGCGDGALSPAEGEECDDGNTANGDGCSASCQLEPVGATCGDGTVDALEICDDGNTTNGDGCNPTCNLLGDVTRFLDPGPNLVTMAADNTYLYMAHEGTGVLDRVDIAACVAALAGGGACTSEVIVSQIGNGSVSYPATDGEKLWFFWAEGNVEGPYIKELDLGACSSPPCNASVTDVAGTSTWGGHTDGNGTSAAITEGRGLTYYAGKLYFLSGSCGTLRRFDPATGDVTTLVGSAANCGGNPTATEGVGTAASLASPRYMASDNSGFLYVTDNADDRIFRYNVATGALDAWVGSGARGYVDASDPDQVELARPRDITSDGSSVYWAAYLGHTVRQARIPTGATTTLAGGPDTCGDAEGTGTAARLGMPFSLVYHFASRSIFVMTAQALSDQSSPPCNGLPNQVWRIE